MKKGYSYEKVNQHYNYCNIRCENSLKSIKESEINSEYNLITAIDNLVTNEIEFISYLMNTNSDDGDFKIVGLTREQFINTIKRIQKLVPDVMISGDVIVGFPQESEEDFKDTYGLCKECFDMLHVFPYSLRPGTVAARMEGQISPEKKKERSKVLLDLSNELYQNFAQRFIDQEVTVLVEKYDEESGLNIGHTSNFISVKIPLKESKVGSYIKEKKKKSMI